MNLQSFYNHLSRKEQYSLANRKNILRPKFPRSLFAYENRFEIVVDKMSNEIEKSKSKLKILDLGCGDGVYEKLLDKNVRNKAEITGVDFSSKQIKKASKYLDKSQVVDLDNQKLPFIKNSFDFVICSEVLEHLFFPEKVVSEIQRVLKPKGIALITVPNISSLQTRLSIFLTGRSPMVNYTKNKEHIRFYSIKDIKLLFKNDFKILKIRGIGGCLFDHWNFFTRLFMPKIFQDITDKYFPEFSNGIMIIFRKK